MNPPVATDARRPFWREPEFIGLVLLVLAGYAVALGSPSLRGEESRRAQIAVEILQTGDWLVPRQQGEPFLFRPPGGSWTIALMGWLRGGVDIVAIRLPSVLGVLLTATIIYWYCRAFLSSMGALVGGVGFATMAQVLQLGRLGENEGQFILYVGGSLLIWHGGFLRNERAYWPWLAGYALAALGTLTKGTQAPIYFGAAVGVYLLWRRQWRALFSWQHVSGIGAFFVVLGAWAVPFASDLGWFAVLQAFCVDAALRVVNITWTALLLHLVKFPLEILVCSLPWSLAFVGFAWPAVRRSLYSPPLSFLVISLIVSFPSVWLVPDAMTRHYMALYPILAVLSALVVENLLLRVQTERLGKWGRVALYLVVASAGTGCAAVTWMNRGMFGDPWNLALPIGCFLIAGGFLAWLYGRCLQPSVRQFRLAVFAVGGIMVLGNLCLYLPTLDARAVDTPEQVQRLKATLGDIDLVSFEEANHLFAYYYATPIRKLAWPDRERPPREDFTYFCCNLDLPHKTEFGFPWQEVAIIDCERHRKQSPTRLVLIGKRLHPEANHAMPVSVSQSSR